MDKNIAALLREDSKTVQVQFQQGEANYTYVTNLTLAKGDLVVVNARDALTVATVVEVHEDLEITPNSNIKFKWVVGKVDMQAYLDNEQVNAEIEQTIAAKYRANVRRQYRGDVLAGLPDDARAAVTLRIGGK